MPELCMLRNNTIYYKFNHQHPVNDISFNFMDDKLILKATAQIIKSVYSNQNTAHTSHCGWYHAVVANSGIQCLVCEDQIFEQTALFETIESIKSGLAVECVDYRDVFDKFFLIDQLDANLSFFLAKRITKNGVFGFSDKDIHVIQELVKAKELADLV